MALLQCCLNPNVCQFNQNVYKFPPDTGNPIGSPLGSLVSEVFMARFETEIFHSNHHLLRHIAFWRRYVDDVFCIWTGPQSDLAESLSFINGFYASIEFTMEIGGNSLNFLDLTITITEGRFDFGIYRKPTSTDLMIHGTSFCPLTHKIAGLNSMIHRLATVPLSDEAFMREVSTIKHIASKNCIMVDIDGMIRKKIVGLTLKSISTLNTPTNTGAHRRNRKRFIRLPYLPKITSEISRNLSSINLRPAYHSYLPLRRLFSTVKDKEPPLSKSGVYLLPCRDCPAVYVGESERSMRTRINDHVSAFINSNTTKSAFAAHLIDANHTGDEEKVLHVEPRNKKRLALENIEICLHDLNHNYILVNKIVIKDPFIEKVLSHSPHYNETVL